MDKQLLISVFDLPQKQGINTIGKTNCFLNERVGVVCPVVVPYWPD
jgi:hypothetical protein